MPDPGLNSIVIEKINDDYTKISSKDAFVENYINTITFLHQKGKKVIFVIDVPELGEDPKLCVDRLFHKASPCIIARNIVDERQKEYRALVQEIKRKAPDLLIYDATAPFCDEEKCYGKRDVIYYGDDDHLNLHGSEFLIKDFILWLSKQGISL
jgi:hypothetical protein